MHIINCQPSAREEDERLAVEDELTRSGARAVDGLERWNYNDNIIKPTTTTRLQRIYIYMYIYIYIYIYSFIARRLTAQSPSEMSLLPLSNSVGRLLSPPKTTTPRNLPPKIIVICRPQLVDGYRCTMLTQGDHNNNIMCKIP